MEKRKQSVVLVGVSTALLCACGGSQAIDPLGNPLLLAGGLNPYLIDADTISPGTIHPRTLSAAALSPDALDPVSLQALLDPGARGASSRMLMRHLVGCALDPGQVFSFSFTDDAGTTHDENDQGMMELAPEWATGPLLPAHEAIVSACIASRLNYAGAVVEISSRAAVPALQVLDPGEVAAYPKIEGAFWGNLFAPTPWISSCGLGANAANSRAWTRDCAVGHLDGTGGVASCGIMNLAGDCSTLCDPLDPNSQFYPQCNDPQNGVQTQVVTTALPPAERPGSPVNLTLTTSSPDSVVTEGCATIVFRSTITSTGTAAATAPVFTDSIPAGLTVESVSASMGSCTVMGALVTCSLPDLAPGEAATISVTAAATVTDQRVTHFATVVGPSTESLQADNTATSSTQLEKPAGTWEQASTSFNATPIAKGRTIWFTTTLNPDSNIPAGTVWGDEGTITFQANGVSYSIPVPSGKVVFSNTATVASTTFDKLHHRWVTTVPVSFRGAALLTAVAWTAPVDLPGGIEDVTLSTHLAATQPGIRVGWQWGAAVYSSFGRDYTAMTVMPSDDPAYNPGGNTHKAGTPESYTDYVVAGALGGGASNYVGNRTAKVAGAPGVANCQ